MNRLQRTARERLLNDMLDSVRRNLPQAKVTFEHSSEGINIRIAPKHAGRTGRCMEITMKGKRCKFDAVIGDVCESHYAMRERRRGREGRAKPATGLLPSTRIYGGKVMTFERDGKAATETPK